MPVMPEPPNRLQIPGSSSRIYYNTSATRPGTLATGRVSVAIRIIRNSSSSTPESWPCDQPNTGVESVTVASSLDKALPEIGFQYPFVLHALLGLSALHIAYTYSTQRTRSWLVGMYHHNEALTGFRRELCVITKDNSEALFTWSICNVLYIFATSNPLHQGIDGSPTSSTSAQKERVLGTEWIPMIRGLKAVLEPTHNYFRLGRMKAIMSTGNWYELDPDQESQNPEDAHFCRARESWNGSDSAGVYEEALQVLRKCRLYSSQFREMDSERRSNWGYNKEWSAPLMFIHFAQDSYFALLRQRQPPALILFSLFGALLHKIRNYWFMEGWGKAIVEVIADILGSYWREWLIWPLEVIHE
ncbi:UPC2-regulatory protein involved in control of sterol uptake [Fusarium fujikuroi]|nr:UPC2-regulatory protein involved in control of sterol uptake [Fusarium fujikuroi]